MVRAWLPPAPADVVVLGTGQGFLALVMAACGHRVRGFDVAEAQLERAREFAAQTSNPPRFALGDAIDPPLLVTEPALFFFQAQTLLVSKKGLKGVTTSSWTRFTTNADLWTWEQ